MDYMTTKRRRRSNAIGLVVMVAFVIAIVCGYTYQKMQDSARIMEAQATVDNLAHDFAKGNSDKVMEWARGEVVDPWENQVVLVESDSKAVQFVSKGADGKKDTEDDVVGEVHHPPKKVIPRPAKEKKGVMTRIKSFFKKD